MSDHDEGLNDNTSNENVAESTSQETRKRKPTEKGKEYHRQMTNENYRKVYKRWRRQLNRSEAVLLDSEDVATLRMERNNLNECFNDLVAEYQRFEKENDDDEDTTTALEFDECDDETQRVIGALNNRIADLLMVYSDSRSTRSNRTRRSNQSARSTTSRTRLADVTVKAARLDAELKFHQLESVKMIALQKQQEEMERLRLEKELAITKAEIDALNKVKEEETSSISSQSIDDEIDDKDRILQDYLEDQLSRVATLNTDENENTTQRHDETENKEPVEPGPRTEDSPERVNNEDEPNTSKESMNDYEDTQKNIKKPGQGTADQTDLASSKIVPQLTEKDATAAERAEYDLHRRDPSNTDPQAQPTPNTNTDALSRLADLLSLVESRTNLPSERLYYLGRYTDGEAKEAVNGLLPLNSNDAYTRAKKLLHERYGNPFLIADAYRKKLNDWPRVPVNDGRSLRKFSDFLEHCKSAMNEIKYLSVLNDPEENQRMLKKLPGYLVARWSRIVDQWLTKEGHHDDGQVCAGYPPFKEFCKFIRTESRIACNPITSLRNLKDDSEKIKSTTNLTFRKKTPILNSFATGATNVNDRQRKDTKPLSCPLCDGGKTHDLDVCKTFNEMNLEKRKDFVRSKGLCWGCLGYGHKSRQCRKKRTCVTCNGSHPSSLHDNDFRSNKHARNNVNNGKSTEEAVTNRVHLNPGPQADPIRSHSLIVPVRVHHPDKPGKETVTYALLDEQSDACFIRDSTLKELGVSGPDVNITLSTVLGRRTIKSRKITGLSVRAINEGQTISLPKVFTREEIPAKRSQIPRPETATKWPHLRRITNDLMPYRSDVEIGILIGLNCAAAIKPQEVIPGKGNEPYAKKTALGWGIIGIVDKRENDDHGTDAFANQRVVREVKSHGDKAVCHFVFQTRVKEILTPQQVCRMFESDFIDKETGEKSLSFEDRAFLKIAEEGIHQLKDGHFEMPLPFRRKEVPLEDNREMALKRLLHLKKRFEGSAQYREDYIAFMNEIIDNGHAERVPGDETSQPNDRVWYIPHHAVYHPKKQKIRVVFDCSATYKGQSLNKQLLQGPDLTNSLVGVLLRFRLERVALMCDVTKMFHQVMVNPECRDFLRFLWWEGGNTGDEPKTYSMKVHLFGAVSSPGCANFTLKKVADIYEKEFGRPAANFIREDFYVDDGLTSVPTSRDAIDLIEKTKALCSKKGFTLHKFSSNSKDVIEKIPPHQRALDAKNLDTDKESALTIDRALGVQWCVESDTFQFRITLKDRPFTKRGILATVSSVFDPLGLVAPVILTGKKILQSLCRQGVDWDEKVPDDIRPKWEKWRADLHDLSQLKIDRCYKPEEFATLKSAEMHHFSDASNEGYGQCSYIRLIDDRNRAHCSLVMAKARVTPLKPITIPRLELSAALVSVRISQIIQREMNKLSLIDVFWTDSKVALGYICNEARRFHVFVSNRVQQIRDSSSPEQWHYVATGDNPADHTSRGLTAKQLIECDMWWNGPKFLRSSSLEYTTHEGELVENDPEVKVVQSFSTQVTEYPSLLSRLEYFSDWYRAKRAIARILRLQQRFKRRETNPPKEREPPHVMQEPLTVKELQQAETLIIKELQRHFFTEEIAILHAVNAKTSGKGPTEKASGTQTYRALKKQGPLYRLDPFLDDDGLLRVGGRLKLADIPYGERHPMMVPRKSHVTGLILCHFHKKVHHQGRGITQNEIRTSGFWIIGGTSVISYHVSRCTKCRKLRGTTCSQKMADLPKDRVEPGPPFTYAAVDCFGPWLIKEGRRQLKRYGVLFTCMASRAIHIEVASNMDADSFINAYRRFIGRRGPVRQLRSDQGTNFVGARNELQKALEELDTQKIKDTLLKDNCDWIVLKTNVPHASHMGGVWERQIRSARNVLNALLERQSTQLDDESLKTLMVEAEAIVNSRPLTTESASSTDVSPLSPFQLLTMKSKIVLPPPSSFERPDLYSRKRWRRVQYLANEFWVKWRKEYLQSLQQRRQWISPKRNIQVDDVVLLKN